MSGAGKIVRNGKVIHKSSPDYDMAAQLLREADVRENPEHVTDAARYVEAVSELF